MVVSWGIDGSLGAASGKGSLGASAAGASAAFVDVSAGFVAVSAAFVDVSAGGAGGVGGISGCAGDGISYGVGDDVLGFVLEPEADEPESVLGLAAGLAALAAGLAPLAGLAAPSTELGTNNAVESRTAAAIQGMREEILGVMAVLSNAKATGWSRPVMGTSPS